MARDPELGAVAILVQGGRNPSKWELNMRYLSDLWAAMVTAMLVLAFPDMT